MVSAFYYCGDTKTPVQVTNTSLMYHFKPGSHSLKEGCSHCDITQQLIKSPVNA